MVILEVPLSLAGWESFGDCILKKAALRSDSVNLMRVGRSKYDKNR